MTAPKPGERTITVDGQTLRLTRPEKVMYPDTGYPKAAVIDYYRAVAAVLLPHLRDRVVTRIRYPGGVGGERFFERHAPATMPGWLRRVTVSASPGTGKAAKRVRYPLIDDAAGLLWMANAAALELHTPQWRVGPRGGVGNPDRLVIDLDPGEGAGLDECARVDHLVADRLRADGLATVPVTSGSKGIHLYAVTDGRKRALAVHSYVQGIARELAARYPKAVVAVSGKAERAGKVMIDWSQNHPARSTATPYTLRGRTSPTVAAPRRWEEITAGLAQLGPEEVLARLDADGDLLTQAGIV